MLTYLSKYQKYLCIVLLVYTCVMGLLGAVPARHILNETIRNLYFHVPMWFAMFFLLIVAFVYQVKYLSSFDLTYDLKATSYVQVALVFGVLGLLTGMLWAKFTWGAWWVSDPKLNGTAISMLMYLAFFVLRSSVDSKVLKAKLSSVYAIISFVMLIVFLIILPRMTDSLHPGNGGNPAFSKYDLDNNMRLVFYPAVIGWILLSNWITQLLIRIEILNSDV